MEARVYLEGGEMGFIFLTPPPSEEAEDMEPLKVTLWGGPRHLQEAWTQMIRVDSGYAVLTVPAGEGFYATFIGCMPNLLFWIGKEKEGEE